MHCKVLVPVLLLLQSVVGLAQQGSETMTKVVTRDVSPGVKGNSFAAQPKTLYRIGQKYARLEEVADTENGIHGLVIIVEPDIWQINLLDKAGRHIVDPGPTFYFHAPIVYSEDASKAILALEFGEEYQFMKSHSCKKKPGVVVEGQKCDRYEVTVERYRIRLFTKEGTETPFKIEVQHKGKDLLAVMYDEYASGLTPEMGLFKVPEGIAIEEAE